MPAANISATYVDRILRGEKPGELPVQLPTKFEMVVNRKSATALGLAIPASILLQPSFNRTKGRASRRLSSGKLKIASLRWAARRSICAYDNRTSQ